MQNKRLVWAVGILTLLVAAWRTLLMPVIAGDGISLTRISWPLLGVMAAAVAVLFWMGRTGKGCPYLPLAGRGAQTAALGGVAFGAVMLITAVRDAAALLREGTAPAPSETVLNGIDRISLLASLLAGVVGGVFLIVWFLGWFREPYQPLSPLSALPVTVAGAAAGIVLIVLTVQNWQKELALLEGVGAQAAHKAQQQLLIGLLVGVVIGALLVAAFVRWQQQRVFPVGWLWLVPVLWAFARLARYDVVYAMSVDISPAVYEFFLYAVALLFLMAVAQYMSGVQKPSRWLRALAAATAALAFSAVLSRVALAFWGQEVALAYTPIPGVAEAALGLFALSFAATLTAEGAPAPVGSAKHFKA